MPTDPRKRQKKLERRASKRHEKKHQFLRVQSAGLGARMTTATRAPVLDSSVTEDFWTQGIGWVLLSRQLPNGLIAVAVFLVDRYCLGVKNALADIVNHTTYESQFVRNIRQQFSSRDVSPATARKLAEEAVAYARDLGFSPHADYHKAKLLFGDIDASQSTEEFEFGKDGKPFFFAGPKDTPQRCQQIMNTLARRRGPDGFHFTVPVGSDTLTLPADGAEHEGFLADQGDFDDEA